jgi:arylsulfatase A-like enzyme
MNRLVETGIELHRHVSSEDTHMRGALPAVQYWLADSTGAACVQYVYKYCSPTRSALQSGRNPIHVNAVNAGSAVFNPGDPVSGMQGIPRNMTGIAVKMAAAGYDTHMFGKCTPTFGPVGQS